MGKGGERGGGRHTFYIITLWEVYHACSPAVGGRPKCGRGGVGWVGRRGGDGGSIFLGESLGSY